MTNCWQEVPLGSLLTRIKDQVLIQDFDKYQRLTIRINNNGISIRDDLEGHLIGTKNQFVVHSGQFLLSKIDAMNGAFGIVPESVEKGIITGNFWAYDVDEEKLFPKYFNYLTHTRSFQEFCIQASSGTTHRKYLREDLFLGMEIPLPPLTEQRRIVEDIELLAARVNEAQRRREEADTEATALHGTFAAKALKEVSSAPKHSIGGICEVRGGIQKSPVRLPDKNPTPYLTVAHVQRNFIDVSSEPRYFEVSPDELPRWKLEIGDLLIIEGNGSADQIGRVAMYRGELGTCVHQNHVIRARPNHEIILSEYLNMYLNSPLGQDEVQKRSRTTSGLRTLSVGRIREIEIPVPPLDEQRRIVAYLDGLQEKVNALRELQSASGEKLSALMPSILEKAFKGEL